MPKRTSSKRRTGGKRRAPKGRGRRLTGIFTTPSRSRAQAGMTSVPTRVPYGAPTKRPRGRMEAGGYYYNPPTRFRRTALAGPTGKNTVKAEVRRARRGGKTKSPRKTLLNALVYGMAPVLKADTKSIPVQFDWQSGLQGFFAYPAINTPQMLEQKFAKMSDALYYNPSVAVPLSTTDVTSQRMINFPSTLIYNMKNTCTHTCYIEARVYKAKGYHSDALSAAFIQSLQHDNLVQNHLAAPYPTEDTINTLYKRPNFKSPYLNCRYSEVKTSRAKWVLEPGQETKFIFKVPGFTFDQAKYNVLVNSVDCSRCPYTYEVAFFCHAETVTGTIDADVCPGSGHIAVNQQLLESWQALPYVKKYQNISSNTWGAIPEADEFDINDGDIVQEAYAEGV